MKNVIVLVIDTKHHVFHIAPIAYTLSQRDDYHVHVLSACRRTTRLFHVLGKLYPRNRLSIHRMEESAFALWLDKLRGKKRILPKGNRVLRPYLSLLMAQDAWLLCSLLPAYLSKHIQRQRATGKDCPKIIQCFHGNGDGEFGFSKWWAMADLFLFPGSKMARRFQEKGLVKEGKSAVTGYCKFDLLQQRPQKRWFNNDRPTVLYNPHFEPMYSSWPRWGQKILEWFYHNTDYNLIFAPHIVLFGKERLRDHLPAHYFAADHMRLDSSSLNLVNMAYTASADIYLWDVSSQIYEFICWPRPCIALNAHGRKDWQQDPHYQQWHYGQVLDDCAQLSAALERAEALQATFVEQQRKGFADSFSRTDTAASLRAVSAINHFLNSSHNQR